MKAARDQGDMNLDFNGQAGDGVNRAGNKYAGNQHGGRAGGNYGRGPTVGNHDTRTAGPVGNGVKVTYNADAINMGRGPVNAGSTRPFAPSATKNYNGNPDMINAGRGPTKGNQE